MMNRRRGARVGALGVVMRTRVARAGALAVGLVVLGAGAVEAQSPATREERIASMRTLFEQGVAAYNAGNLPVALEKMLAAQRTYRNPAIAFNIARVYERMADAGRAEYWFRAYLQHGRPTDAERADVERRIAALQGIASRQQQQLMAPPPSENELAAEARTFFLRGVALYEREQYRAALEAFTAAMRFSPLPEIFYNLALTSERLEQKRDAIDYYREYLRVRRDAPDRAFVERRIAELRESR